MFPSSAMNSIWPSFLSVYPTVKKSFEINKSTIPVQISIISLQTLRGRSTSCPPVFIKFVATSRVKPFYPFPRKATYLLSQDYFYQCFNLFRAPRILMKRSAKFENQTENIVTCC